MEVNSSSEEVNINLTCSEIAFAKSAVFAQHLHNIPSMFGEIHIRT